MIKRLLISSLAAICLCTACVNGDTTNSTVSSTTPASTEDATTLSASGATQDTTEDATSAPVSNIDSQKDAQSSTGLSEADLVKIMETACGANLETKLYVDMDKDGKNELLGAFATNYKYQTWYCSSDGKICEKVLENSEDFDACQIDIIEHANAVHTAVNTYNLIGNYKTFAILALQDGKINCLTSNQNGYAGMDESGNPCVTIEGYDAYLDQSLGTGIGHTWKTTYITFDEKTNTYLEIPAKVISEAEFLKFANGQEALDAVKAEKRLTNPVKVEYSFFKRSNGFAHIQCAEYDESNSITFYYFTLAYEDNTFTDIPGESHDGIMSEQFTEFKLAE